MGLLEIEHFPLHVTGFAYFNELAFSFISLLQITKSQSEMKIYRFA